jgi:hypothetical protein
MDAEDSHLEAAYEDRASGTVDRFVEDQYHTYYPPYVEIECPKCHGTDIDLTDETEFLCLECRTVFTVDEETGEAEEVDE